MSCRIQLLVMDHCLKLVLHYLDLAAHWLVFFLQLDELSWACLLLFILQRQLEEELWFEFFVWRIIWLRAQLMQNLAAMRRLHAHGGSLKIFEVVLVILITVSGLLKRMNSLTVELLWSMQRWWKRLLHWAELIGRLGRPNHQWIHLLRQELAPWQDLPHILVWIFFDSLLLDFWFRRLHRFGF